MSADRICPECHGLTTLTTYETGAGWMVCPRCQGTGLVPVDNPVPSVDEPGQVVELQREVFDRDVARKETTRGYIGGCIITELRRMGWRVTGAEGDSGAFTIEVPESRATVLFRPLDVTYYDPDQEPF